MQCTVSAPPSSNGRVSSRMTTMYTAIQISSLLYGSLCGLYLFYVSKSKWSSLLKLFCKILPLLSLVILLTWLDGYKRQESITPYYFMKMNKFIWAVVFVTIGEVYIYFNMTLYRMISVIIAYGFLNCVISFDGHLLFYVGVPEIISLHLVGSVSGFAIIYSLQRLKRDIFLALSSFQALAVMLMLWFSVTLLQLKDVSATSLLIAFGAAILYVSDLIILVTNSRRGKITVDTQLVIVSCYAGFYCIMISIILD